MATRFLLIDVGNTTTDFALATPTRIVRVISSPTNSLHGLPFAAKLFNAAVLASVVPAVTRKLQRWLPVRPMVVTGGSDLGIGIRYPNPEQIGPDRLANAVGVVRLYGAPAIVVDFGTAVTFDVVNTDGEYVGGVIAPGLSAMTDYLYQRTALLPHITVSEPRAIIGKSTTGAMLVGAVVGYRGLVKEILAALQREPGMRRATVVATGGYANLIGRKVAAIKHVNPLLTLDGLRLIGVRNFASAKRDTDRRQKTL